MTDSVLLACQSIHDAAAIRPLRDRGSDVITLTVDLGQDGDLLSVRQSALGAGAIRAHVLDARDAFVREYVLRSIQADARQDGIVPLAHELGMAAAAQRLTEVARMERASAVAYIRSGGAPDLLETSIRMLEPSLRITPLPISAGPHGSSASSRANLWGRSLLYDSPSVLAGDREFTLTKSPHDCADEGAIVAIEFACGVPVRANGVDLSLLELVESLEVIAGSHGVGRIGPIPVRPDAVSLAVYEAPAAVLLHDAHHALEAAILPGELRGLKAEVARTCVDLLRAGSWFSPVRAALDAFVSKVQHDVSGVVRMELRRGSCRVLEVRPSSNESRGEPPTRGAAKAHAFAGRPRQAVGDR